MDKRILCVCYSRTGKTLEVMKTVSQALDCELIEISDTVRRRGFFGAIRCGLDAVGKRTHPILPLSCQRKLSDYSLVILGTPIWAGRCASVARAFLRRRGYEVRNIAYLITHASEEPYKDVFDYMDRYPDTPHVAEVSLCPGATGCEFWIDQFVKTCAAFVENGGV